MLLHPVNGMDGIGLPVVVHARVCPQDGDTRRRAPGDALQQAKNPDGALGMDTVGVILATLEYDVFLQVVICV